MSEWFEWRALPKADFAVIGDPVSHSLSPVWPLEARLRFAGSLDA